MAEHQEEAGVANTDGSLAAGRRAVHRLGQRLEDELRRAAMRGRPIAGASGAVRIGRKPDGAGRKLTGSAGTTGAKASAAVEPARRRASSVGYLLTLDSFQPWRTCSDRLVLAGERGFKELRFAARCPTGVRGTPPHLDVLAIRPGGLVAVTARGGSYLTRKEKALVEAYAALPSTPGLEPWQALASDLAHMPEAFCFVDVANLVKLAIGLGGTFRGFAVKLLYLFFEPPFAEANPCFAEHRAELARVVARVDGSSVTLVAQSFAELWAEWEELGEAAWLRNMVAGLRKRYDMALDPDHGL